jgi:signal transduction histidine kinase
MKIVVFIVLLFFTTHLVAQNQHTIDSLLTELKKAKTDTLIVKNLNLIGLAYLSIDSTKGFQYSRRALTLSKKINWKEGIASSNYCIGAHYGKNFVEKKALYHFNQALANSKDKLLLSNVYAAIGQFYLHQSNYTKALDAFHKSLQLSENSGNKKGVIKVSMYIGSVYSGTGNNKKALIHYTRALGISNEINEDKYLGTISRCIGVVHSDLGDFKKALLYFEKGYSHSLKTKNLDYQANILSDIALVYLDLEEYKKAISYSKSALKIQKQLNIDKLNIAFNYGVIGDSYIEMSKKENNNKVYLDSAVFNLNQSIQLHKEINSLSSLTDDYISLTMAQKLKGNYKSALESYEMAVIYKDSIYNSDNKETIKNLEDKREIELRDREIKINNLKLEAKEKQKWFLILGLALLGIIGGLLLYQNRNRKKANEKLQVLNTNLDQKNHELDQANKVKARFFGILNHDLRSPVYNLIHFLHLQKENPELLDEELKDSIQTKTMISAENLLQSMEDMLLWSKGQMENFQPQPQLLQIASPFEDTKKHFSSEENIQFIFENPSDLSLITDENYLKTIIRNLTSNAINAFAGTEHPTIIWKAWKENNKTILSITDNGPGANQEQFKALYDDKEVVGIKSGLGLHLIRDLAKAIDCEILVESKINEGTTFILKFIS